MLPQRFISVARTKARHERERARKRGKYKSRLPEETVQVHARALGELQWICPKCGCMGIGKPSWKTGRVRCKACDKSFMVGVMLWKESRLLPPFNGVLAEFPGMKVVNRQETPPKGQILLARFAGTVQWECVQCKTWHGPGTYPDWHTGKVECKTCGVVWYVAPIFYHPHSGLKAQLPRDWVPPRVEDVLVWIEEDEWQLKAAETIEQRYRKNRRGDRGVGQAAKTQPWFNGAFGH